MSTEDALRDALDQVQQVEKLMEAMRSCPDKAQAICNSRSASGIHQQDKAHKQELSHCNQASFSQSTYCRIFLHFYVLRGGFAVSNDP
ncbi:CAP-Gly domain-containing linker protein 2-like isoform X5 [Manis pentadactyla]|uniref:CAP-Gly domain-containing linker protein 2-like isoform X5 n=1 Tax=Manis pentadactyla TaxID=143292 RepID=UPI00255C2F95|nr:CAP-Gly domain-containing linker protein 2-like isoform X5 [Manis pentadactyla]